MGDGHPDGGAAGDGLDHRGQGGLLHQLLQVVRRDGDRLPPGGGHQAGHQSLGHVLIHGDGGGQAARPGVGHAQQVQGGLDAAVLPAGAVEGQEHHVGSGAQLQHPGANGGGALVFPAPAHLVQVGGLGAHLFKLLGNGGLIGVHGGVAPLHAEKQIHQGRLVPLGPQSLAHHGAGGQGDVPLRAQAAGQYDNFHGINHLIPDLVLGRLEFLLLTVYTLTMYFITFL